MNLEQFLLTADPDHSVARQQARDFVVLEPQFITSNTLTVYVVRKSLYAFLSDQAQIESPVRSICMALMDRLRGVSDFNLSASLPLGQANRQMLDTLIAYFAQTHPEESVKLTELKDELEMISEKPVHPFSNTTLHDVMITRDDCPTKYLFSAVTPPNKYIIVGLLQDTETHAARITAVNPRTNVREILGRVWLSKAALYQFKIPTHYLDYSDFQIDDAYGAIQ